MKPLPSALLFLTLTGILATALCYHYALFAFIALLEVAFLTVWALHSKLYP